MSLNIQTLISNHLHHFVFHFRIIIFDHTLTHEFTHYIEGNILNAFVTCFNKEPKPSIRLMGG